MQLNNHLDDCCLGTLYEVRNKGKNQKEFPLNRCLARLSAAAAYLNDKGCSLRQKQYYFLEKRRI